MPSLYHAALGLLCLMPLLIALTRAGADIALCGIGILFLVSSVVQKEWEWTRKSDIRALGVLWCFLLISAWFSPYDPQKSFLYALLFGRFLIFYAAVRYWLLMRPEALKPLHSIGLAVLAFTAMHMLVQYFASDATIRLTLPFTHNPNVGHFMLKLGLPMLGLLTYRLLAAGQMRRLWMPAMGVLIMVGLVMITGERSAALLTLLALGVLGLVLLYFQKTARKAVLAISFGLMLMLAFLATTQTVVQQRGLYLIEQIGDFWGTVYGQLFLGAWRLWEQHPLTGIGIKQFSTACDMVVLGTTYCDIHPHNMYFDWLVSTGIIGLALLFIALIYMVKSALKEMIFQGHGGVLAAFALATLAVLFFPVIVTQSPFSNWPAILHWYSLSLTLSLFAMTKETSKRSQTAVSL